MAIVLSGSLILSGSLEATGGVTISGSIASASFATSGSYSLNALTSSNAMTASSADTLYVRNNVTALGSITAQTLIVQTITSSVLFTTGSNKIGSSLSNVQELTGSVGITGSLSVNTNGLFVSSSGNVGIGNISPTVALDVTGAGKFSGALTLTGALGGTTATFSGDVSINSTNSKTGGTAWNLNIRDNTALAANIGGGISFQGVYTTGGSIGNFGAISSYKTNATSGNESGGLKFYYSANGIITQGLQISETGAATFSSTITSQVNGSTFGTASAIGRALIIQAGSTNQAIMFKNAAGGDGTLFATGTSTTMNYSFNTYSTADAFYIQNGGNVGIGTSSPTGTYGKLSVAGGISILNDNNAKLEIGRYSSGVPNSYIKLGANSDSLRITNNNDSADIFTITNSGNVGIGTSSPTSAGGGYIGLDIRGSGGGSIQLGSTTQAYGTMYAANGGFYIQSIASQPIIFYTSAEAMRIASSGDIMFKDTSGNNVVYFTAANPSLSMSYSVLNRTASSPMYWNSSTGLLGLNTSARRFKKDIVSITSEQTKIALLLNPVEYTRIETNEKEFGFIAEEVRDAGLGCFVPEIDGEALTIDYSKLSVFAIAMIKEQQKAIQELSAKNTSLEERLLALENAQ